MPAMSHTTIADLNRQFPLGEAARFIVGHNGLPCLSIATPAASAAVFLHGAHLTHFQPTGRQPVLWLSGKSNYENGKPIRGGVPICFPWFGPKADDSSAPIHGLVRSQSWLCRDLRHLDHEHIEVTLGLVIPDQFDIAYTITVGPSLSLRLSATNISRAPARWEMALHTYFAISDIHHVTVHGLDGVTFIDKMDSAARKVQRGDITISAETDRVYVNAPSTLSLADPGFGRRTVLRTTGAHSAVVWNPWIEKSKKMADFGDDEWPGMICIETANAADNALTIPPGASHAMTAAIEVVSL
jgi:glucose-6-phosphate 1-epimerase